MMKVKYIDPKTGATGLYDGGIYEVIEACEVCGGRYVVRCGRGSK